MSRGGVLNRRWLGLVLAALVTVLATLMGAGMASAETRGGLSTTGAQDVDARDGGLSTSRSVLLSGAATEDEFVAAPSVASEHVYDGAVPIYGASVLFVDARTVARVASVGHQVTVVLPRSRVGAASVDSVWVSGFVVAAKSGAAASARVLGANLERSGLIRPGESAAHHIVAGGANAAAPARSVLSKYGIDINSAKNKVFLPRSSGSANPDGAAVHSTLHTSSYYESVNDQLLSATSSAEVFDYLSFFRVGLLSGGLG